jgi:hypothetical protein
MEAPRRVLRGLLGRVPKRLPSRRRGHATRVPYENEYELLTADC